MTPGATRFVRYAYPPNALGYCGPDDHLALFEYGSTGAVDGGLRALAAEFEGAWPYLELVAYAANRDPLDSEVVEAYWIGNRLLDRVDLTAFGNSMETRFRARSGSSWDTVSDAVSSRVKPTHAFHVFCVYPWVGLMRTGSIGSPLQILDQCRIRWGRVAAIDGDSAIVESHSLEFDGTRLSLSSLRPEKVTWASDGQGLAKTPAPGHWVSMHWGWICERISTFAVRILERETAAALAVANRGLAHPRTGVLG
jgi:hypothetical protein